MIILVATAFICIYSAINKFEEINFFFPGQRGKNCFKHFESFSLNLSFCSVLLKAGIPTHSFQSRWTFWYLTLLSPLRYFRNSVLCKQTFESRFTGSIISRNVLAQFGCIFLLRKWGIYLITPEIK